MCIRDRLLGGFTGAVCAGAIGLKYRFGFDDSLDVVGVHMVGGIIGTLGVGALGSSLAPVSYTHLDVYKRQLQARR